jgi:ferredoxin
MGHIRTGQGVYGRLQKRLDRYPIGAPPAPALYEILKRLYTEEEAEIACRMPIRFTDAAGIARRTGKSPEALLPVLERMAEKGLVMDFEHKGKAEFILSPTLFGFFEFSFMRIRDDIPQKELARYMVEYAHDQPDLARSILAGKVRPGRTLVHETAVDPEDATRILDHERSEQIVREAKAWAVSLCYCRHVMEHEGRACAQPMEVCTTLNDAADFLVRRGLARKISREEALEIFAATREAGLVHIGDNVKRRPAYVCHCCGCCCAMLSAINRFKMFDAVVTSPFLAAVDEEKCTGCGACAKKCPVGAIEVRDPDGTEAPAHPRPGERLAAGGSHGHRAGEVPEPSLRRLRPARPRRPARHHADRDRPSAGEEGPALGAGPVAVLPGPRRLNKEENECEATGRSCGSPSRGGWSS